MARALSHDTRLLILDEPSAVLDQEEVDNLFRVMRGLTAEGVAIIYISHRLEEIRQIGDRITVLKDGRTVATGLSVEDDPDPGADHADDRPRDRVRLPRAPRRAPVGTPRRCSRPPGCPPRDRFHASTSRVHAGEIVGLAGLVGSGRSEILETHLRRSPLDHGHGRRQWSPAASRLGPGPRSPQGIGLAPEERKSQGLLLDQAVYRNVTVSSLEPVLPRPASWTAPPSVAPAEELTRSLDVRPAGVDRHGPATCPAATSRRSCSPGGRCATARCCSSTSPPGASTSGRAARSTASLRRLADEGVAVVVVSSEVEEVLGLADRVLVISEGFVVHEGPATEIDESKVLDLVMEGEVA